MAKQKRKKHYFSDGFSIDETKVSILMITYSISFIVCLIYFVYTNNADGVKTVFLSTITAVTGINLVKTFTAPKTNIEEQPPQDEYATNSLNDLEYSPYEYEAKG